MVLSGAGTETFTANDVGRTIRFGGSLAGGIQITAVTDANNATGTVYINGGALSSAPGTWSVSGKVRHGHVVRWDKYDNCFWVVFGDSNAESAVVKWDGISAVPDATPQVLALADYTTTGYTCLRPVGDGQRNRGVDILFDRDWVYINADNFFADDNAVAPNATQGWCGIWRFHKRIAGLGQRVARGTTSYSTSASKASGWTGFQTDDQLFFTEDIDVPLTGNSFCAVWTADMANTGPDKWYECARAHCPIGYGGAGTFIEDFEREPVGDGLRAFVFVGVPFLIDNFGNARTGQRYNLLFTLDDIFTFDEYASPVYHNGLAAFKNVVDNICPLYWVSPNGTGTGLNYDSPTNINSIIGPVGTQYQTLWGENKITPGMCLMMLDGTHTSTSNMTAQWQDWYDGNRQLDFGATTGVTTATLSGAATNATEFNPGWTTLVNTSGGGVELTLSTTTPGAGATATISSGGATFDDTMIGRTLRLNSSTGYALITARSSSTVATVTLSGTNVLVNAAGTVQLGGFGCKNRVLRSDSGVGLARIDSILSNTVANVTITATVTVGPHAAGSWQISGSGRNFTENTAPLQLRGSGRAANGSYATKLFSPTSTSAESVLLDSGIDGDANANAFIILDGLEIDEKLTTGVQYRILRGNVNSCAFYVRDCKIGNDAHHFPLAGNTATAAHKFWRCELIIGAASTVGIQLGGAAGLRHEFISCIIRAPNGASNLWSSFTGDFTLNMINCLVEYVITGSIANSLDEEYILGCVFRALSGSNAPFNTNGQLTGRRLIEGNFYTHAPTQAADTNSTCLISTDLTANFVNGDPRQGIIAGSPVALMKAPQTLYDFNKQKRPRLGPPGHLIKI